MLIIIAIHSICLVCICTVCGGCTQKVYNCSAKRTFLQTDTILHCGCSTSFFITISTFSVEKWENNEVTLYKWVCCIKHKYSCTCVSTHIHNISLFSCLQNHKVCFIWSMTTRYTSPSNCQNVKCLSSLYACTYARARAHTHTNSIQGMKEKTCHQVLTWKKPQLTFLIQSQISDIHGLLDTYLQITS